MATGWMANLMEWGLIRKSTLSLRKRREKTILRKFIKVSGIIVLNMARVRKLSRMEISSKESIIWVCLKVSELMFSEMEIFMLGISFKERNTGKENLNT